MTAWAMALDGAPPDLVVGLRAIGLDDFEVLAVAFRPDEDEDAFAAAAKDLGCAEGGEALLELWRTASKRRRLLAWPLSAGIGGGDRHLGVQKY